MNDEAAGRYGPPLSCEYIQKKGPCGPWMIDTGTVSNTHAHAFDFGIPNWFAE